ncbi:MAG: endolytic transglycosylase MltG [Bacteroidota bacterium]
MKKKFLVAPALLLMLAAAYTSWIFFGPNVKSPEKKYFYIKTGENYEQVRSDLLAQKIIPGKTGFSIAAKFLKYKIARAGRYEIKKGMSIISLVRMLRNGSQSPVNFVITKIRTKEIFAAKAGKAFECDSLEVINFLNNNDSLKRYGMDSNTVMATLMPYTYAIKWNITAGNLYQQFYTAYKTFWTNSRKQKADSIKLTPLQVSTLASIIEEETNKKNDKLNIASVYLNRIKTGMPLQADPTIKFALKDFALTRIYHKHLEIVSPYNTYINTGLPPGPICTPSIETIDAVLDAPKTDYLYFVASSKLDGTSVFTTNYDDHIKYAHEYQKALDSLFKLRNK